MGSPPEVAVDIPRLVVNRTGFSGVSMNPGAVQVTGQPALLADPTMRTASPEVVKVVIVW